MCLLDDIMLRLSCLTISERLSACNQAEKCSALKCDTDTVNIFGISLPWCNLNDKFIIENRELFLPLISSDVCVSVYGAGWILHKALEQGAACYTHTLKQASNIEVKEYIMPDNYKFFIVKPVDNDDHLVMLLADFKWMSRVWSFQGLNSCRIVYDLPSCRFKDSLISFNTVCDYRRFYIEDIIYKYNVFIDTL